MQHLQFDLIRNYHCAASIVNMAWRSGSTAREHLAFLPVPRWYTSYAISPSQ
jgi:hypothetical protein